MLTSPQKVSHHHLLETCPLSIFQGSVLAPLFQEIFALSRLHLLFLQEQSNVPVQGALQPRCCIYQDSDLNPDPATYGWVQLTYPLCVSQFFHLENENTDVYPTYSQEEKIFKIFSTVSGWQKYLLDEKS